MNGFRVHTVESAPAASRPILEETQKTTGFVPNLDGVLAESPALLQAYLTVGAIFDRLTSFNARERQVVLLTAIFENECDYCMAAHSTIAAMQRVPDDVVHALRSGAPIPDERLEALRGFARSVVRERGRVATLDVDTLLAAGFTRAQLLEVILGVGLKVLSSYANHIAGPPVDVPFQANAWNPPGKANLEKRS